MSSADFRHRRSAVATLLLAVSLAPACASRTHVPYDSTAAVRTSRSPDGRSYFERFNYPKASIDVDENLLDEGARYEVRRIAFPSIGDNGQPGDMVAVDYHRSRLPGRHPVVLVLPIWGRFVYPSNAMTRTLRGRSDGHVHVFNVLGPDFLIDWPELAVETDEQAFLATWAEGAAREITTLIDLRRLLDWAVTRPEIDIDRVGIVGFSHGAMLAPTLAAVDRRFDAIALVMGGAHPHEVIARCAGVKTGLAQQQADQVFGWSADDMAELLRPLYAPLDPANYPGRVDPERVVIFESGKDQCIPSTARDALWQALGRPDRFIINATHRRAFLAMTPLNFNWMRKRIWSFFEERLLPAQED